MWVALALATFKIARLNFLSSGEQQKKVLKCCYLQ